MTALAQRIEELDSSLFSFLEAQTMEWDRRALLGLHAAAAAKGQFAYLEIGSYMGGSLQALMRDPRCERIMSIDPRPRSTPDDRGGAWIYEDNSVERMVQLLGALPDVDLDKLTTFETGTDSLSVSSLPCRPTYCLIDGEHTHEAVIRDARFCAEALGGEGVIAFHDYVIVGSAISEFLRDHWREVSFALAFNGPTDPASGGGVFAVAVGDGHLLKHPAVTRAVGSRWHSAVWWVANRPRRTALPLMLTWALMPAIDSFVLHARHGLRRYVTYR
jgi:hypothetical protein